MIELSSQDVISLYGRYLFVIPEEEKQKAIPVPQEEVTLVAEVEAAAPPPAQEEVVEAVPPPEEPKAEPVLPAPPEEIKSELTEGAPVAWKMKAQSRIAMVMAEAEFKNRAMTIILRDCVERAGMPTSLIGFGVLQAGATDYNFSDQPVPFSIAFSPEISEQQVISLSGGQEVYPMPAVSDIVLNLDKQEALIKLLQQLNERL